jgi:putative membrane protein insertion efficiency factor
VNPLDRLASAVARGMIRGYRFFLSPLLGRQCRYLPTCSHYAEEAIATHGPWLGSWLGLRRLCRCHPWGGAGYDPVPQPYPPGPSAQGPQPTNDKEPVLHAAD